MDNREDSPPALTRSAEQAHREGFARIVAANGRWLFAYLMTLLANPDDAEEVFQETSVVLWREYEKFDLGTDFRRWASTIAYHQVQKFRREKKRCPQQLSDVTVQLLAAEVPERFDLYEPRRDALKHCIKRLPARDHQLIQQCYTDREETLGAVAKRLGRSANTVYKAVSRIRRGLLECVERTLSAEGWT